MLNGVSYPQPNAERRISATGSGFIATPTAKANQLSPSMMKHASCRKMLPTPSTVDDGAFFNTSLGAQAQPRPTLGAMAKHNLWPMTDPAMGVIQAGGKLNPTWVEWLMGWPLGWTDLKPLAMDKFQQWLEQHGPC